MASRRQVMGGVGPRGPPAPMMGQGAIIRGPAPGWGSQGAAPLLGPGPGGGGHEQKHSDVQRLVQENQRLVATHVALRQELAASQGEIQRLQSMLGAVQAEKDATIRAYMEKNAKVEAELRAVEPMKAELQAMRLDLQSVHARRQELEQARVAGNQQLQALTQELQKARTELQQYPAARQEAESLRQEIQRLRSALEFEKKSNTDNADQRQAMENNLVTMAREVEKLRAELTNLQRTTGRTTQTQGLTGSYGIYPAAPAVDSLTSNPGLQRPSYKTPTTGYGVPAIGVPLSSMEIGMGNGMGQYTSMTPQMGQTPIAPVMPSTQRQYGAPAGMRR